MSNDTWRYHFKGPAYKILSVEAFMAALKNEPIVYAITYVNPTPLLSNIKIASV